MAAVGIDWREAGFPGEDRGRGRAKGIGDPSADSVPEGVQKQGRAVVRYLEVGSVRQNGKKKTDGDAVGKEGAGPSSWGREAFYEGEGGLGEGQAVVEVVGGIQGGQHPVA